MSNSSNKSSGEELLPILIFIVAVVAWPALAIGFILNRILRGRVLLYWLICALVGAAAAFLWWMFYDPGRQLAPLADPAIIHNHIERLLPVILWYWLSTVALFPLAAAGIELLRPRNASEQLLAERRAREAASKRRSRAAAQIMQKQGTPDQTEEGYGVLGRTID